MLDKTYAAVHWAGFVFKHSIQDRFVERFFTAKKAAIEKLNNIVPK
jgi:hypothetical protein